MAAAAEPTAMAAEGGRVGGREESAMDEGGVTEGRELPEAPEGGKVVVRQRETMERVAAGTGVAGKAVGKEAAQVGEARAAKMVAGRTRTH